MDILREEQRTPAWVTWTVLAGFLAILYTVNRMTGDPATINARFWLLERASGFVAYELLSLTAILGVSMTSRIWDRWRLRKLVNDVHQYASLLVWPFLMLHLWGLYNDKSVPFSARALFVPFQSSYRPLPVAIGVICLYLIFVISLTSYARPWLGAKLWHAIHYISFPLFLGVSLHGFFSGTDSLHLWARTMYAVPLTIFLVISLYRLLAARERRAIQHG
ncbi:hypothetical protein GCM10010885_20640 [Alicyclobacillus cellulosilyticus]|uniref:Ferric reductase like protein n=1 Tax=Alicyclobacillus cellulosilyticus TaxID=1003997 RepID=A0A917NM57_9BACL|nr:ferric reductase-like transmembrane domain-containing protein [Alicyclobacillus cellulosilyticus]GGJ11208.1 hypothetical protein GCM10010885_20640 [Alicyclobacillus cellulosilyticus]